MLVGGLPLANSDMGVLAEQLKVHAELIAVVELDAEDHRFDGNLQRTLVDLADDLVDLREHRFVVAHQHRFAAGKRIAAGLGRIGADSLFRRGGDADRPDALRQQRRDQRLHIGGANVVRVIDSGADLVERLFEVLKILRRADVDELPVPAGHVAGRFENRGQRGFHDRRRAATR